MTKVLRAAFVMEPLLVDCKLLLPSKRIGPELQSDRKYRTILASIEDVGLIEPLSVSAADPDTGARVILDGHVRLAALNALGVMQASCLEALDDEAFTYNSRVNRMSTVQEHHMLRRAIQRGVSAERLARALSVNLEVLRKKVTLLDGICAEAAELMKDRQFSPGLTTILRKMKPARQIACVELMISANMLTMSYAKGLLYTSAEDDLLSGKRTIPQRGISAEQLGKMQQEVSTLQDRYRAVEHDYGENMLNLTVVCAYLNRLLANVEVAKYLGKRYPDVLAQLTIVAESTSMQR